MKFIEAHYDLTMLIWVTVYIDYIKSICILMVSFNPGHLKIFNQQIFL